MITFFEPSISCDKHHFFNQLHLSDNPNVEEYSNSIFDSLVANIHEHLELTACYTVITNDQYCRLPLIAHCRSAVICFIGASRKIDTIVQNMMEQDDYLDGFLLDHLASQVLFNASNQLNAFIEKDMNTRGLHLTRRYSPGSDSIELYYQADLLSTLKSIANINVNLTEQYMLNPERSMMYYYGADAAIPHHPTKHDCSICTNTDCSFRDTDCTYIVR